MAVAAAFNDPRFPKLREDEVADLDLEISVLSPMCQIKNIEEIQVGRDGLYIERGPYRGLLLPQVATEYGWDRLTFLKQTCIKAGLPPDAWEDPSARIFIFSANILHEPPKK
jgi:AmmeMemoRadiSam system protein A